MSTMKNSPKMLLMTKVLRHLVTEVMLHLILPKVTKARPMATKTARCDRREMSHFRM
jgi:hypothetical protein